MFGVFVYLYCSLVSIYSGVSFWRAWKRGRQEAHRDFATFFFLLAAGFLAYIAALPFKNPVLSSFSQEVVDIFVLVGLGFVVMAVMRFQQILVKRWIVGALVCAAVLARMVVGAYGLADPAIKDYVIYSNYPQLASLVQGALVILFTAIIGATLLMNLKNVQRRKKMVLFLGGAFLIGGLGGALAGAYDFFTIFFGFVLLFVAFTMIFLSVYRYRNEESAVPR